MKGEAHVADQARLILIKHSHVQVVPELPPEAWPLSEEGQRRCDALAERLRPLGIEVLLSSHELKARQTADRLGRVLGLSPRVWEGVHEHDRRNVPVMRTGDFISAVAHFFRHPDRLVLGDETASQAKQRFERAVQQAQAAHPGQSVAIVTHGTVLSLYAADRADQDAFQLWRRLQLPSYIAFDGPDVRIVDR
jgi:broad specificity phosphatase PhoE